jgi:predicted TIM-barrel fold metal-dependent hydrolase
MAYPAPSSNAEEPYRLYSCDDHMDLRALPKDLWTARVPAGVRDRVPQVRPRDGREWVFVENEPIEPWGPRKPPEATPFPRAGIEDAPPNMRPSTPELRLADMDRDGVQASVIYGPLRLHLADPALQETCLKIYNDWGRAFCAHDPNRLAMLARLPTGSCEVALAELRRMASTGARGFEFSAIEVGMPLFTEAWEPLWRAAAEAGSPFSFHIGGGMHTLRSANAGSWARTAGATVARLQMDELLVAMIFSGALERHPGLVLVLGESGIGWLPYIIERMDQEYHNYRGKAADYDLRQAPSEIFARQVLATYEEDPLGVSLIPRLGPDNVMWASDYPHGDSTWPNSRALLDRQFAGLPEEIKRKATRDNCKRIYRFD